MTIKQWRSRFRLAVGNLKWQGAFAGIDVTTHALVIGIKWHYHQRVNSINEGSKVSNYDVASEILHSVV